MEELKPLVPGIPTVFIGYRAPLLSTVDSIVPSQVSKPVRVLVEINQPTLILTGLPAILRYERKHYNMFYLGKDMYLAYHSISH